MLTINSNKETHARSWLPNVLTLYFDCFEAVKRSDNTHGCKAEPIFFKVKQERKDIKINSLIV